MFKYGQVFYKRDGKAIPTTTVVEWEMGQSYVADLRKLCKRTVRQLFGYPSNDLFLVEVPRSDREEAPVINELISDPGFRWQKIRDPDCGCQKWARVAL